MSDKFIFLSPIPEDFWGTEEDFNDIVAEEATKLAISSYLRSITQNKNEYKKINSDKMNCFMASLVVLNRAAKKANGKLEVIDKPPSCNIIAEFDEFSIDETEMNLFRHILLNGASINFEPLLDGKICISVVVPETYEE